MVASPPLTRPPNVLSAGQPAGVWGVRGHGQAARGGSLVSEALSQRHKAGAMRGEGDKDAREEMGENDGDRRGAGSGAGEPGPPGGNGAPRAPAGTRGRAGGLGAARGSI